MKENHQRTEIYFQDTRASLFGLRSWGMKQLRGNGDLVVTPEGIRFTRRLPHKEIFIPRGRLISIERTRSFLGKIIFKTLAKVAFYNEQGQRDEIAWFARDLESLEAALEKLGASSDTK